MWENYFKQDEIGLINVCLMIIGESPLENNFDINNIPFGSDAYIALNVIEEVNNEIQTKGWWYNSFKDYKLQPDINGFISLPSNILRIDFKDNEFILKGKKVFDRKNVTYKIGKVITVNEVVFKDKLDELPKQVFSYISLRAGRKFQQRILGNTTLFQMNKVEEQEAYEELIREDIKNNKYNISNLNGYI